MSKLKKIIAVVIALVMLLGVVGITSSAAGPIIELSSKRTQVTNGSTFDVTVSLSDETQAVGGVEGTITYNSEVFKKPTITLTEEYQNNGNVAELIDTKTPGTIKFAGLVGENDTGSAWFTISFVTAEVDSATRQTITVKASGSNKSGTAVESVASLDVTVVAVPNAVKVMGSQIKYSEKNDNEVAWNEQDLRFLVNVDKASLPAGNIVEYGVLLMFTKRLEQLADKGIIKTPELTYDMIGNANIPGLVVARKQGQDLNVPTEFGAQLTDSAGAGFNSIKGVRISARGYVRYDNDTIVYYSNNELDERGIKAGYASKSFNGTLKATALLMLEEYDRINKMITDGLAITEEQQKYFTELEYYANSWFTTARAKDYAQPNVNLQNDTSEFLARWVADNGYEYLCAVNSAQ